ncbi:MAG TPA: DUF1684 domain-containing protein [Chloroflexota bacterium]|nr:DUF1684 domain-containing protein [Chloroflexota bacterium]
MSSSYLELLDWRRRVAELFAELRSREPDATTLAWFRAQKDALFRAHPQSPISPHERAAFTGLSYWEYEPAMRITATFAAQEGEHYEGEVSFVHIGTLEFGLLGQQLSLAAHWIDGYAGGLFVPFRDATCGHETYGGGRYMLDTIKSADLGSDLAEGSVVLDFNYAYHPSCAYDPRWVCPLAPAHSQLSVAIRAGERLR